MSIANNDLQSIYSYLVELGNIANWIALIERSQLGSFSWPFANELRRMAIALLSDKNLKGDLQKPIVHVVADGGGYRINYESGVPASSSGRRFSVISFPRSLKHHVLLHSIFAHELGHAAIYTQDSGRALQHKVIPAIRAKGALVDPASLTRWVYDTASPAEVKHLISAHKRIYGRDFQFEIEYYNSWIIEIFCDLFGLVLFGPSFIAAHRALLRPLEPTLYSFNPKFPTHPPYAVRHKILIKALRLLGWHTPVTDASHGVLHTAETELINYITEDSMDSWADLMDDAEILTSTNSILSIFNQHDRINYVPSTPESLINLLDRLQNRLPPIDEIKSADGKISYKQSHITQTIYAGWVYWLGRAHLTAEPLDFLLTNRLCDHALLQQEAINLTFF